MKTGRCPLSSGEVDRFRTKVYGYYHTHARDLPWRRTSDAYEIFISEVMLQQTQVERVMMKFGEFITAFPTFSALADASLRDVFALWQGLGYNRRALSLVQAARAVVSRWKGDLPGTVEELSELPGIGRATASALLAFAFGKPTVFIETNVRRVFIDHFFRENEGVKDRDIIPYVDRTLDRGDPRNWYYALMDYGSMLRKEGGNPNRRSAHYRKQAPFRDSDRRIRGMILRLLLEHPHATARSIETWTGADPERLENILVRMREEGLVGEKQGRYSIS